jgi:putative transposase
LDEKSGIQALERPVTTLMRPGRPERQEFEYVRHGTQTLIANLDVASGELLLPTLGKHRKEEDLLLHCKRLIESDPSATKWQLIMDGLNVHMSESLVRWIADMDGLPEGELGIKGKSGILASMKSRAKFLSDRSHFIVFHYTPKHCSWLNQIEIWFSILSRKLLRRGSFRGIAELKRRILGFIDEYNKTAKPFRWTCQGKLLRR